MVDASSESLSVDVLLQMIAEGDFFAAVERLANLNDPVAAAELYAQAALDAYWKRKDLAASVALGRAGIQHALTAASALRAGDAERSRALRGKAKAMAYNVASFTWPGWDEQGIDCTPTLVAMGFDAARTNLRLAIELERGELARSRALWMLAGHLICRGELAAARETYIAARDSAAAAKSVPEMRLSDAFAALTQVLQNPAEQAVAAALEAAKHQLRRLEEHGAEFLRQLETAQRIFAVPTMSANHAV